MNIITQTGQLSQRNCVAVHIISMYKISFIVSKPYLYSKPCLY